MDKHLDLLSKNRNQILFIELAGLLHDIGKLSKAFLEYRQKWQDDPHGWDNDPHNHDYLKKEIFKDLIPADFNKQIKDIKLPNGYDFCEPDFSIKNAVHLHTEPPKGALINYMLNAADGVDSAIDRNNPLWGNEQKTGNIYRSNVFGYETGRIIDFESQEKARQELYRVLNTLLPEYLKPDKFEYKDREEILKKIKKAFEQGLSDTTRPQNDTTLWEHSYAVASILKVIAVHNLLNDDGKIYKYEDVKFGILGIGWDGMKFISQGQKIGDIVGRKQIIKDVKNKLKELIEDQYPVGNEIYSDDDGIYFIAPVQLKQKYSDLWEIIENKINSIASKESDGELQPHIETILETQFMTNLVKVINNIKKSKNWQFSNQTPHFNIYKSEINKQWHQKTGKTVCPICRLRPVEKEYEDNKKKICKTCKDRRNDKTWSDKEKSNETVFIDEIVDKNKRACLIVARFGLDEWLNGNMARSLFVTEAKGIEREIEHLEKVKQFSDKEGVLKKYLTNRKYNYHEIYEDIDSYIHNEESSERAKHTAFLYHRRDNFKPVENDIRKIRADWSKLCASASKEMDKPEKIDILLYNILCAKTPTPSTILDVWATTLEFVEHTSQNILKGLLPENNRLSITFNDGINDWGRGILEAEVIQTGQAIEMIFNKDQSQIEVVGEVYSKDSDKEWVGKEIRITDKESSLLGNIYKIKSCSSGAAYCPCRTITTSPNLFMAIVPAEKAIGISALIYQKYIEYFGKVMGRLPFSIGNIFFGDKMPMFVVLDAGKRMVANFDRLSEKIATCSIDKHNSESSDIYRFDLQCNVGGHKKTIKWQLPYRLGNCDTDYYHPYFIIGTEKDLSSERQTFFKTIVGNVVHFDEVKENDQVSIYPNYYDFEFLDSNQRRHDIYLDKKGRRKSNVADFKSKPFLLDELSQKIMCIWDDLLKGRQLKGITDTKLRNLQSLWLTKYQEWEVSLENKIADGYQRWISLIMASIQREFKVDGGQKELLLETINNGLFFDMLELYHGIMKQRIDDKNEGGM